MSTATLGRSQFGYVRFYCPPIPKQLDAVAAVLPSLTVLDKIMRYETKLERQQYRAMIQLERVQRLRRGEAVPPLTMEVSEKL